jgi:hypothetical protein
VAERLNASTVTKLSPKLAQNRAKSAEYKKVETSVTDSWQRDLFEFSVSYQNGDFILANRRIQPLCHLSAEKFEQLSMNLTIYVLAVCWPMTSTNAV